MKKNILTPVLAILFLFSVCLCSEGATGEKMYAEEEGGEQELGSQTVITSEMAKKLSKGMPPEMSSESITYLIHPGDVLEINVFGAKYMHNPPFHLRVSETGTVYFPLIGEVKVGGLTEVEAIKKLDDSLRDGYLNAPQVTLVIMERAWAESQRQFSISGAVAKPGKYPVTGEVSLVDAINLAGGLQGEADTANIEVYRQAEGIEKMFVVDLKESGMFFEIIPRDKIVVSSRGTFLMQGQIVAPGRYYLSEGLTVTQAIIEAGGFTPIASENGVKVIRELEDGKTKILRVPVASILRTGDKSKDVALKDGDIIVVPESWF